MRKVVHAPRRLQPETVGDIGKRDAVFTFHNTAVAATGSPADSAGFQDYRRQPFRGKVAGSAHSCIAATDDGYIVLQLSV
ncbi:hypothetical protein D9M71_826430 [compost metagenome]